MRTINPDIIFTKGYDPKKVFVTEYKSLEGRLDALYYSGAIFGFLENCKFPLKPISEITQFVRTGFAVGKEEQADEDSERYIQLRPTNMNENGELKFEKNIYVGSTYLTNKRDQILSRKEVLFNNTNSQELVGKTCFFDLDGVYFCSNHVTRLKANTDIILPEYLCWVLNYYQQQKVFYNICTNWNNQSGVGSELLKTIKIPIPPISTQIQIVIKLNSASEKRRYKEAESRNFLEQIDTYILDILDIKIPVEDSSIKNKIFTVEYKDVLKSKLDPYSNKLIFKEIKAAFRKSKYEIVKLKNFTKCITSGATPLAGGDDYTTKEDGIPFIRSGEINQFNEIDFENCLYIKKNCS